MSKIDPRYEFNLHFLRAARVARNIPVAVMAESLGISRESYYKKESGTVGITVKDLCLIMAVMDLTPDDVAVLFTRIRDEGGDSDVPLTRRLREDR